MTDSRENNNFERQIFMTICGIFAFFMAYYVLNDITLGSYPETLIGDVAIFLIMISIIILTYFFPKRLFLWMNLLFAIAIIGIFVFWPLLGGSQGPLTYTILFIISMIGILFPFLQRIIYISALIVLTIMLCYLESNFDFVRPINQGTIRSIPFDFILNLIGMAMALIYLRNRFDTYHDKINDHNVELHQINSRLEDQTRLLKSQGERIEKINGNLQKLVDERTRQLDESRELMKKKAIEDSNDLRAPISNILVLLPQLSTNPDDPLVKDLRIQTQQIDQTIRKVNDIMGG